MKPSRLCCVHWRLTRSPPLYTACDSTGLALRLCDTPYHQDRAYHKKGDSMFLHCSQIAVCVTIVFLLTAFPHGPL